MRMELIIIIKEMIAHLEWKENIIILIRDLSQVWVSDLDRLNL